MSNVYDNSHRNIEQPKVFKRKSLPNNKNYCCGRCNHNTFELVDTDKGSLTYIICSNCQAIANENCEIIIDKHPSSLLMSLRVRK